MINVRFWLKFSLINLLLVSLLGLLMRYKIGFEFPFFNQKYLQEAHSHFAFAGWISHTLYVLIADVIKRRYPESKTPYHVLLIINLACAYGMLVSFAIQGYGPVSLTFSSASILLAFVYAFYALRDIKRSVKYAAVPWFKAALILNVFSSLGTLFLGDMMATGQFNDKWYLASIYFYLHFQYNGFFLFACFGLIYDKIDKWLPSFKKGNLIFWLFLFACPPAYLLSILWASFPVWVYPFIVAAALMQFLGWLLFFSGMKQAVSGLFKISSLVHFLFLYVSIAFTIKLLLQLGSTIPALSKLAFSFRPVVIAYLHLVLLAIISVFLLAFMYARGFLKQNTLCQVALAAFACGVFLNELVLGAQGAGAFIYEIIPFVNESLFAIACILSISMLLLVISQYLHTQKPLILSNENGAVNDKSK